MIMDDVGTLMFTLLVILILYLWLSSFGADTIVIVGGTISRLKRHNSFRSEEQSKSGKHMHGSTWSPETYADREFPSSLSSFV